MDHFSDNFLNYEEIPMSFDKMASQDFSLTSPNSDSTGLYGNSSPPQNHGYFFPQEQFQINQYQYSESHTSPDSYHCQQPNSGSPSEIYTKTEVDDRLLNKTKRNVKRQIAKERTKVKQDTYAFLEGVDSKFLPEGFDDPNLDERTKKKMVQMVRNRISAQNSRDRKKVLLQKLEDINTKLCSEKDALVKERNLMMQQMQNLQQTNAALYEENQTLRNGNVCSLCRRAQSGDQIEEDTLQNPTEEFNGGYSGLNSPVLARFASGGRGFMTFFAFAAVVSFVVVMGIQQTNPTLGDGLNNNMKGRFLETENVCKNPDEMPEITIDPRGLDWSQALVLRNIGPLMDHFKTNSESYYKAYLGKTMIVEPLPNIEYETIIPIDVPSKNAIVNSNYFQTTSNLRGHTPAVPTLMAENLPIKQALDTIHTSTLFCPSALQFTKNDGMKINISSNYEGSSGSHTDMINSNNSLERTDYLQLLIPKNSVSRFDIENHLSGYYEPQSTLEDTDTTLEIWCKVFYVRELTSTL